MVPGYAELHCISNYSFLRGASDPEELVHRAAQLGYLLEGIDWRAPIRTQRPELAG